MSEHNRNHFGIQDYRDKWVGANTKFTNHFVEWRVETKCRMVMSHLKILKTTIKTFKKYTDETY